MAFHSTSIIGFRGLHMKSILLLTFATILVLPALNAHAGATGNGWSSGTTQTRMNMQVASVNAAAGTIQILMLNNTTQPYKIDSKTHVLLGGHPVGMDKIAAGMVVIGFTKRDPLTLDRITVMPAQ
jgi:hypothetical protein